MDLREALIAQRPSLELQRAAQAEIARLDAQVRDLTALHYKAQAKLARVRGEVVSAQEFYNALVDGDLQHPDSIGTCMANIDNICLIIHED